MPPLPLAMLLVAMAASAAAIPQSALARRISARWWWASWLLVGAAWAILAALYWHDRHRPLLNSLFGVLLATALIPVVYAALWLAETAWNRHRRPASHHPPANHVGTGGGR